MSDKRKPLSEGYQPKGNFGYQPIGKGFQPQPMSSLPKPPIAKPSIRPSSSNNK